MTEENTQPTEQESVVVELLSTEGKKVFALAGAGGNRLISTEDVVSILIGKNAELSLKVEKIRNSINSILSLAIKPEEDKLNPNQQTNTPETTTQNTQENN